MSLFDSFNTLFYAYNKMLTTSCASEGYHEITVANYQYLLAIFNAKHITTTKLSELLGIKKSSVTQMIHILISKGYVQKIKNENDKRSFILDLTAKGTKLMESEENIYISFLNNICKSLSTEELNQLDYLLNKMVREVEHLDGK